MNSTDIALHPAKLYNGVMMRIIKKTLLIISGIVAGLVLLTVVCLMIMPHVVSSATVKDQLETILTDTLDHAVSIENIEWSWRRGIAISGVRLQDHPDFSLETLAAVTRIGLKIDWPQLLKRRLVFDARIAGPSIHMIRTADGRINVVDGFAKARPDDQPAVRKDSDVMDKPAVAEAPVDEDPPDQTSKPGKKAKADARPFVLPIDIIGRFELTDLFLALDDQEAKRHIAVTNAGLRLDLPSLKNEPICLALHLDLSVDHEAAPPSAVSATISGLFDETGALNVQNAAVEIDVDLPGLEAALTGDMKDAGIRGDIHVNLDAVMDLAYLFAPDLSQRMRPTGAIHLRAAGSGMPDAPISFDIFLSGEKLGFSGSVIQNRSLSSGKIDIHAAGSYDIPEGRLMLDAGRIRLLEYTGLDFSGKIDGLKSEEPFADVTIASLDIHMDEVVSFLVDFMPPDMLVFPGTNGPSIFMVRQLGFSGGLKAGPATVACETIRLDLPHLIVLLADGTNRMSLSGVRLTINDAQTSLTNFFPVSAGLTAAILVDSFDMTSPDRNVSIENIHLDTLRVMGDDIQKVPDSPFTVAGRFSLSESLRVGAVSLPPLADIKQLHQFIDITVLLNDNGMATAALDSAGIHLGNVEANLAGEKHISLSGRFDAALPDFRLSKINPLTMDLSRLTAELSVDDALTLGIRADVADTGRSLIRSRAGLKADLARLMEIFADFIAPDLVASGLLNLDLNIDARLPDEQAMTNLKNRQLEGNLNFLNALVVEVLLPESCLELGLADNKRMTVTGIFGDPLLSYALNGRSGEGKLSCRWQIGGINGIPGLNSMVPVSVNLNVDAAHRFLSALDLNQRLTIDPIGIQQAISVNLDGLDRLLASENAGAPYAALSRVGAVLSAGVDMADFSKINDLGITNMPAMDLRGAIAARADLHMIPGNRVTGDVRVDVDRVSIDLKDTMTLNGADAGITWSKTYRMMIIDPGHPDRSAVAPHLSKQVLQPDIVATRRTRDSGNDIYRHLKQSKERTSPSSEISVNGVSMRKGPLPLHVGPSRIVMDAVDGVPGISYFEFDLLGGAINGALNLVNEQNDFRVRSTLNFSGINTAAFFPELYSGRDDPRAEIRGTVYADIPVTHELTVLLENMTISVEFTKIGSRAIERLLFALDPHESNEAVMAQRRLLKSGSPRWVRMDIRDGFLSIQGEVSVRNINIPLPAIQRLNIARLPGIKKFESAVAPLETVALLLGRLAAKTLVVYPDGKTIVFQ